VGGIVLRPGDGECLIEGRLWIKADLAEIGITETRFRPRQNGARLHVHRRHADSFCVLEGGLTFKTTDRALDAGSGATFIAPPGVVHGFDNDEDEPARYLNFHAPGSGFVESLRARLRDPDEYDQTRYDSFEPPDVAPSGARVVGAGAGDRLEAGTRIATIKVARNELTLVEFQLQPGFEGPSAHMHRRHVDAFYVVDGRPQFRVGDDTVEGEPGTFVAAPRGVVHSFSNPGPASALLVNVHAPSCDFHAYLHAMDEAGDELDEATHARYDVYEVEN
jgi:mannose-6-phosphate isomerase-like protein (cupin superfamily)